MSIPLDAIDPDAGYRHWVDQYLWHVDHLPQVFVEDAGQLVLPHLRAAKIQEKVTGGGYVDNIPVSDSRASRDMNMLWGTLRAYLGSASSRLGVEAPVLPITLPEVAQARAWAYDAATWLRRVADHVYELSSLADLEKTLFGLIARYATDAAPVPDHEPGMEMGLCEVCGQQAVLVDWIDGALAKACTVCGTKYGTSA